MHEMVLLYKKNTIKVIGVIHRGIDSFDPMVISPSVNLEPDSNNHRLPQPDRVIDEKRPGNNSWLVYLKGKSILFYQYTDIS